MPRASDVILQYRELLEETFLSYDVLWYKSVASNSQTQSGINVDQYKDKITIGLQSRTRRNPDDFDKTREVNEEEYDYRVSITVDIEMGDVFYFDKRRFVVRTVSHTGAFKRGIIQYEVGRQN